MFMLFLRNTIVNTLIMMVVNALLGIAIPIFLAWWAVKKHKANLPAILFGAAVFLVFALVLESLVHQIVLKGPRGATIQGNALGEQGDQTSQS